MHCQRTREWLSVALDSELSQFERALVRAHVDRCGDCRAFDLELRALTGALRGAQPVPLSRPVAPPRWGRHWHAPVRVARIGSAVAAVAAMFVGALLVPDRAALGVPSERVLVAASLARPSSTNDLMVDVRRAALENGGPHSLAFGSGGIGAYKPPLSANLAG